MTTGSHGLDSYQTISAQALAPYSLLPTWCRCFLVLLLVFHLSVDGVGFGQVVSTPQVVAPSDKSTEMLPHMEGLAGVSDDGSKVVLYNITDTQRFYIVDSSNGRLLGSLPIRLRNSKEEEDGNRNFYVAGDDSCIAQFLAGSQELLTLARPTMTSQANSGPLQKWDLKRNELIGEINPSDKIILAFTLMQFKGQQAIVTIQTDKTNQIFGNENGTLCFYSIDDLKKFHTSELPRFPMFPSCLINWDEKENTIIMAHVLKKQVSFQKTPYQKHFRISGFESTLSSISVGNGSLIQGGECSHILKLGNDSVSVERTENTEGLSNRSTIVATVAMPGISTLSISDSLTSTPFIPFPNIIQAFSDFRATVVCVPEIGTEKIATDPKSHREEVKESFLGKLNPNANIELYCSLDNFERVGGTYNCYTTARDNSLNSQSFKISGLLLGFSSGVLVTDREIFSLRNKNRVVLKTSGNPLELKMQEASPLSTVKDFREDIHPIAEDDGFLVLNSNEGIIVLNRKNGELYPAKIPELSVSHGSLNIKSIPSSKIKGCYSAEKKAFFVAIPSIREDEDKLLKLTDEAFNSKAVSFPSGDRETWKSRIVRGIYGYRWHFYWVFPEDGSVELASDSANFVDVFPAIYQDRYLMFAISENFEKGAVLSLGESGWKTLTELNRSSDFDLPSIVSVMKDLPQASFRNALAIFFSMDARKVVLDFQEDSYCRLTISLPCLLNSPAFHTYHIDEKGGTMRAFSGNMFSSRLLDGFQKQPIASVYGSSQRKDIPGKMYGYSRGTPMFLSAPNNLRTDLFYVAMDYEANRNSPIDWFFLVGQDFSGTGRRVRHLPVARFANSTSDYPSGLEVDPLAKIAAICFSPGLRTGSARDSVVVVDLEKGTKLASIQNTQAYPFFDSYGNIIVGGKIASLNDLKSKGTAAFVDLLSKEVTETAVAGVPRKPSVSATDRVREGLGNKGNLYYLGLYSNEFVDPFFSKLKYCGNDIQSIGDRFSQFSRQQRLRFLPMLVGQSGADRKLIDGYFDEIIKVSAEEDTVVIAIASHGISLGRGLYLALPTSVANSMQSTGLDWGTMIEKVASMKAKRVVVLLDACHAGSFADSSQEFMKRTTELMKTRSGLTVIAACSAAESSLELDGEFQHGAFTQGLLDTMVHPDALEDSFESWFESLKSRVSTLTKGQQTPVVIQHSPVQRDPSAK